MKNTSTEYQWIKFLKDYFCLEKDIFACFSYLSPCSFHQKSDEDTLEAVIKDVNTYKRDGQIIICGDLNARTGTELDFIHDDNDKHLPLDPAYIIDHNICSRKSEDAKVDDRGRQITELCISTRMRLLNGRCIGDTLGKFTCHKPSGAIVVDYAIVSEELLKDIMYFHVHPFIPTFSDCHCKISFNLRASFKHILLENTMNKMPIPYKWTKYSQDKFQKALRNINVNNDINNFLNTTFDLEEAGINQACSVFNDIIINVANKSLTQSKTHSSKIHKSKRWYDEDLFDKRRQLNRKAFNMCRQPFNKAVRDSYYKQYREYRKLVKYKKKNFTRTVISQLDTLETKDPKAYWQLVNSLKEDNQTKSRPEMSIEPNSWYEYFQNLNSVKTKFNERTAELNEFLANGNESKTFNMLDSNIKDKEILQSVRKLKNNKATGLDNVKNEMLKHGVSTFLPCLSKLFNMIFSSGIYPSSWATSYITPIFKTGDSASPENYRGIAISSNIGKLFNIVLNARLDKHLEENKIIDETQIGFTKFSRTSDHMFVLKSLIDKYISTPGGRLYTCFVDFRKAFDTVIHPGIKFKLQQLQINGKFYDIINSLYSKGQLCVRLGESHTNFFSSEIGVHQGDVLSPNLFKIFINDFPEYLKSCNSQVTIKEHNIDCLMYADDIVLLSDSPDGLQLKLDALKRYCNTWCLEVNISKTKVLVFNKAGKILKDKFYFSEELLESVQHYRYLGIYFSASGVFNYGQKDIFNKSLKASFKLTKLITSAEPSIKTSIHLYDHLIKPVALYGSEIWGAFKTNSSACKNNGSFPFPSIYNNNIADKSQFKYLRYILGVNKYSSNIAVLSETGRFPMYFSIIISIVKYLHRLENSSAGLLKDSYELAKGLHIRGIHTWFTSAVYILSHFNLDEKQCKNLSENHLKLFIQRKLIKDYKSFWEKERVDRMQEGKLDTYFSIKRNFGMEKYLILDTFSHRKALCQLRISAHNLSIESGRYTKNKSIPRDQRICKYCKSNSVESEFHFLTACTLYEEERVVLYKKIYNVNPNFISLDDNEKAHWLLIQENLEIISSLAFYVNACFKKRNNVVLDKNI